MRGPGSIPTGVNILSLDFFCFQAVKPLMPMLCVCEKPDLVYREILDCPTRFYRSRWSVKFSDISQVQ